MENELVSKSHLCKHVLNTVNFAVDIVDQDCNILFANKNFITTFGEQALGKKCYDIYNSDGQQCDLCPLKKSIHEGDIETLELTEITRGDIFSVTHIGIRMPDGSIAVLEIHRDITDRKVAEDELKKSEEKYRKLFEMANDAIFIADPETGIILDANKMAEELFSRPVEDFIGKHATTIHAKEEHNYYEDMFKRVVKEEGGLIYLAYVVDRNGNKFPVQISTSMIELKGKKVLMGIFRDITELKSVEETLRRDKIGLKRTVSEKTEALRWALKELEDAKRLSDIGALAGTVAHELRNPLGVIKTALYNIKKKNENESIDSHIINVEKKIAESDGIIDNLLTFSRIRSPHYDDLKMIQVLDECIDNCKDRHPEWNVEVEKIYNLKKNDIIEADSIQMIELFSNILNNAYEAFPDKRGKVTITANYEREGNLFTVAVQDNGSGIEEEDYKKIFEPFFTKKSKGVGLGLTVSKQIAALHGGLIEIEGRVGAGTMVQISLPIKRSDLRG